MKKILATIFLFLLLSGCKNQAEIIDNGRPGQIKVLAFLDENRNRVMDQDEVGLVERVAISQDISCPGSDTNKFTIIETDTSGTALFPELQPGTYCVMYLGSKPITTRITQDIHLSSDQEAVVYFGLAE